MTSAAEHHEIFENLGAFALGALPESERARVAAHLEGCPVCAEDAASLQRTATGLIDTVPVLEPPPALRDRIMAIVEPEAALVRATSKPPAAVRVPAARRSWVDSLSLRWATAAAALLIVGGFAGASLRGDGGPETRTLSAGVGRGHAWVEVKDGRGQLVVDGLAAPGKGKVYELWIQTGNAAPRPASTNLREATFVMESGRVDIPARLDEGDRVMVTAEPEGGSRIPTATPVVITARV